MESVASLFKPQASYSLTVCSVTAFLSNMLMNAFAAEIALFLVEPEAELILTQHIQGFLFFVLTDALGAGRGKELKFRRHSSKTRFSVSLEETMHFLCFASVATTACKDLKTLSSVPSVSSHV